MTTKRDSASDLSEERQITHDAGQGGGHILTNVNVWSPDSQWIVYDTRSDADGAVFDGSQIAMANAATGETRVLYESTDGAHCGVATFDPTRKGEQARVAFIVGPSHPTADWQYSPAHRQGVLVDVARPGIATNLDARDLHPPRTPGALRGGSHVHIFSPRDEDDQGESWVSFTYNDALLPPHASPTADTDARNVGVAIPRSTPIRVPRDHPRNHDGAFFSFLATRTTADPRPGSDDVTVAQEEGWIGANGYLRADGTRRLRALAFQGTVRGADGEPIVEVFVADLPDDPTVPSPDGPLEGTPTRRPSPPLGTAQRRLTRTERRLYPGIQGPRHWMRSSPDGTQIATLMRDDAGIVQLWIVSPIDADGSSLRPITRDPWAVASAFTWSGDGRRLAYIADRSVFTVEVATGIATRHTPPRPDWADAPLPLACIFSPDGRKIAYLRRVAGSDDVRRSQIFVVAV